MVEIELNGKKVEVPEGSMVMHAAEISGTYIPHFCWHKKLSIAANCRMCLVDVEKAPKPVPACATPVTNGMVVRTRTDKAVNAQKSVMEFLLINHPLDCPVCDQGGECQLQDLALGYGMSASRFTEEKRVVLPKEVGPLLSLQEMTRCIHCTRCIRFGEEIGGIMELGMVNRGEFAEITTIKGDTVDSELSGNMIDICPVGAITSKPFRFSARTWELSRRRSVSPHDSTGANLNVQVKNHKVLRVVPYENEDVNECWLADRDRFSYEALNCDERLTKPMIKQGGQWQEVDWQTALEYVGNGLRDIIAEHGANSVGALVSPHSTLEELYLVKQLLNGLGSQNIDHRLRAAEFPTRHGVRWLGTSIASLSTLQSALVLGSNLRKDHPLFAQRIRQAVRKGGCSVNAINAVDYDWAMAMGQVLLAPASGWVAALAQVAAAIATQKGVAAPAATGEPGAEAKAIAAALLSGERKAILLGNAAAHHAKASSLLALAQWIGSQTGASVGYLCEAANTVGAQWVKAEPGEGGLNAGQMLAGALKAAVLFNTEPEFDSAAGPAAAQALSQAGMVVTLSPFKANMAFSDVLLPIAPFTETSGTFVNAEGRIQSFHAAAKALGDTRPGWKVLRVLGTLLEIEGMQWEASQDVLAAITGAAAGELRFVPAEVLDNTTDAALVADSGPVPEPVSASIYQLDGLVRRSRPLQMTADAHAAREGGAS
ncbi:NADH-quinone oxidoreductase subunit NuoG [Comamonas sp. NLF-1-9]|uniref:NADH-quinone oxidoreductase subunit NuoG n=1 Tax=Comamonas sp. NLF-1-9 TaxID=2853163 RepID=UPI001C44F8FA|nr:NADH-quinone oxidoreductase subunit NuoG [Comamonas sp. NLF-1-9]QXL84760.1 NADH-quinone oxidoreductase subunit NuoG [Comamonas sp. NLF-1-9]